jgi:hypothetical protein
MSNMIDTAIVFRILKELTKKWTDTDAFKTGLIDKNGKIIVPRSERTPAQNKSLSPLIKMIFNLKRLLQKLPGNSNVLTSYIAALGLLQEQVEKSYGEETADHLIERMKNVVYIPEFYIELGKERALMESVNITANDEMDLNESSVSGASVGGSLSGASSLSSGNNVGIVGKDSNLFSIKKKKKKNNTDKK